MYKYQLLVYRYRLDYLYVKNTGDFLLMICHVCFKQTLNFC